MVRGTRDDPALLHDRGRSGVDRDVRGSLSRRSWFTVAGPFMSSAHARQCLEHESPNLAVLDIMIKDGTCVVIARELKRRSVPFVLYSGLAPIAECSPELRDAPWLEKPASRAPPPSCRNPPRNSGPRSGVGAT